MSDLVGNQNVCFPMLRLICDALLTNVKKHKLRKQSYLRGEEYSAGEKKRNWKERPMSMNFILLISVKVLLAFYHSLAG